MENEIIKIIKPQNGTAVFGLIYQGPTTTNWALPTLKMKMMN